MRFTDKVTTLPQTPSWIKGVASRQGWGRGKDREMGREGEGGGKEQKGIGGMREGERGQKEWEGRYGKGRKREKRKWREREGKGYSPQT